MPMALGHEAAGIVEEVGPAEGGRRIRPRAAAIMWCSCSCRPAGIASRAPRAGRRCASRARPATARAPCCPGHGGCTARDGTPVNHHLGVSGFADYATVSRRSLVKIDPDLPLDEAALFGCAVLTGVGAVVNTARMPAGSSAAVIGLGGVGLASLLGAVAAGARTIVAIDLADDKLAFARELGATVDGQRRATPTPPQQVKAATGGGVEYAFDLAGSTSALDLALPDHPPRRHHRHRRTAAAHRDPAAGPCHPGRRGTHAQRQLHRHRGPQPRHPPLHRSCTNGAGCPSTGC